MIPQGYFLMNRPSEIDSKLADIFAGQIIPTLTQLITSAGKQLATELGYTDPFAVDEAIDRVLCEVTGMLSLQRPDDLDEMIHIGLAQLDASHARAWFDVSE